jgi:Ca2+-binding EF-hand superfamily protein
MDEIEIKNKEKQYFEGVFQYLCELEKEPSSDENSKQKKYYREINEKAKSKQMKSTFTNFKSKTLKEKTKKKHNIENNKKFKEDEDKKNEEEQNENNIIDYKDPEEEEKKIKSGKFGVKALRKIFKKLTKTYNKNEIKLMIWEVDTNLDGFISYDEYERMYKRCLIDEKEKEPKKLYHLIQFLMFDKERKGEITEEDTLEVLVVRNNNGLDNAINDIFDIEKKDEKGNIKRTGKKKERMNFKEFSERMHNLSLRKRTLLMNKKKLFCEKVKEEVITIAVKGMLPKGPLGRQMYTKLFVYAGPDHKHQAQKPEVLTF